MPAATQSPQPATADWTELRALHVKGISLKELSDTYGISYTALRSRSSREKWCNTVAKARDHVLQAATDDLTASANSWISKIDKIVHQSVDNVLAQGLNHLGLKDLSLALDCAQKVNQIARQTYNLDAKAGGGNGVQINIAVGRHDKLQQARRLEAFEISSNGEEKAVDIG